MTNNRFVQAMKNDFNYTRTDNGALAHKSTGYAVYDLFARGGAMRQSSDADILNIFNNALNEDEALTRKCLFYLRDVRGGQGERRFFRVCLRWMAQTRPDMYLKNIELIPEYGRWDDIIYTAYDTSVWPEAVKIIRKQLTLDMASMVQGKHEGISLLGKWLPSENASSSTTKMFARRLIKDLKMTPKVYRKTLSALRERIKVLERLMSANRWEEIEFDKIPSKAGLVYRNAFARRDIIREKYKTFAQSADTKVNAKTLFPYEVVEQARYCYDSYQTTNRQMINKYWDNLANYFADKTFDGMAVVDTSSSMTWGSDGIMPIDVAISLGMYCAEKAKGPFHGHYISFSRTPRLVSIDGFDFVDKVHRIVDSNVCQNTNLRAVFDMIRDMVMRGKILATDIPKNLVVISDMQIDRGSNWSSREKVLTDMETIRAEWALYGLKMPKLVYWNVNASNPTILDDGPNVSYVSGCSPSIFEQIMTGKTGYDLMMSVLDGERYRAVK